MNENTINQEANIVSITPSFTLEDLKVEFREAKRQKRFAFVLGNGINRYAFRNDAISWNRLIRDLWKESLQKNAPDESENLSITEIYDIMCMRQDGEWKEILKNNQDWICKKISEQPSNDKLQNLLIDLQVPVLTTNYDNSLEKNLKREFVKNNGLYSNGYSETYPINEYFAQNQISSDEDFYSNFSVWHINGTINHKKSLRLGTADYMGLLAYTKKYLNDYANMYNVTKEYKEWGIKNKKGEKNKEYGFTWLNIFYNCSLCINGLGLNSNETFLRWLLISRKKYLDRIGLDAKGWYICSLSDLNDGKKYFLQNVGFKIVVIDDYDIRYKELFEL